MLRSIIMSVAVLTALGAVAAPAQQPDRVVEVQAAEGGVTMSGPVTTVVVTARPSEAGEYWVGMMCVPADPALHAQLNLPEKQGLLVLEVVPESPAAKAGIVRHDILVRFGERTLGDPRELVEAVEKNKDAAAKIELIRGGKRQTVEVKPAKRPEAVRGDIKRFAPGSTEDDWGLIQGWLEGMRSGHEGAGAGAAGGAGGPPVRFRFFHPGAIVPEGMAAPKPMPANMSVIVSKEGDKPAKIAVRRGDEKWEVTEKELDKLPEDVRPFVERMLGRNMMWLGGVKAFDVMPDVMVPAMPGAAGGTFEKPVPPHAGRMQVAPLPGLDPRIERRFDEMNSRMDRLFKLMEEMMRDRHEGPAEEK